MAAVSVKRSTMTAITENCPVIIMDINSADCAWELTRHRTTILITNTSKEYQWIIIIIIIIIIIKYQKVDKCNDKLNLNILYTLQEDVK